MLCYKLSNQQAMCLFHDHNVTVVRFTLLPFWCCYSCYLFLCPAPVKWWCTSWRLTSVTYVWPKSRTKRPGKTKIDTEIAHVTHDADTTFKVKGQGHQVALVDCSSHYIINMDNTAACRLSGAGIVWRPPAQFVMFENVNSTKKQY